MSLDTLYTKKQQEVLDLYINKNPKMMILGGAKRSGKTVINNDLFLMDLKRVRKTADRLGIRKPQYILAGADLSAIQRNVLNDITNKYGIEFKLNRFNQFKLFGVLVCCFGHSKINDMARIRGMTSFGCYVNECTMANYKVLSEILSRNSGEGAIAIMDTNPSSPSNPVKINLVDKADQESIGYFHFRLDDNTFLTKDYIENQKQICPSGAEYARNIDGAWCAQGGICFKDFNRDIHYISRDRVPAIQYYFTGVDFGWEHPGTMVLCGRGIDNKIYVVGIWCKKHRQIEDWIKIAQKDIVAKCGDILFYCDSARPEHIKKMQTEGLRAMNALKDVSAGISLVDSRFKTNDLYIVKDETMEGFKEFDSEIDTYGWKDDESEQPVKIKDDVMDALRYAVYSDDKYGNR